MEFIWVAICLCLVSSASSDIGQVQEQDHPVIDVLEVPTEERLFKREVPSVWDLLTGRAQSEVRRVARNTDHMLVMGSPYRQQSGQFGQSVQPNCIVETIPRSTTPWQDGPYEYQLPQARSESQLRTTGLSLGGGALPSLPTLPNLGSLLGGLPSLPSLAGGVGATGLHDGLASGGLLDGGHHAGIGGLQGGGIHGGHHLEESLVTPVHKENIYAATIPFIAGYKMTPIISHKKVIVKDHDLGLLARSPQQLFYQTSPNFQAEQARSTETSPQDFYIDDPKTRHPLDMNIFFVDPEISRDDSKPEFLSRNEYADTINNLQQQLNHLQSLKLAQERHSRPDSLYFV